jgi:AraC family transcriptional regulator of arabinose operon
MNIFSQNCGYFCGIITYNPDGRFGPRQQQDLQLVAIHSGGAEILIDGERRILGAGEATLLLPGHQESFQFCAKAPTRHSWFGVSRPHLDAATLRALRQIEPRQPFNRRMRTIAALCLELGENPPAEGAQLRDTLVQAIILAFLGTAGALAAPRPPRHPAVDRACAFIEEKFTEPLNLAAIAAMAGVTPAHLIRLFNDQLQITPTAFLWRLRTEAASRLLRNTGLSAAEVAYQCGFANPHHFSRVFKQHHGLSPGAWRRREWGTAATP